MSNPNFWQNKSVFVTGANGFVGSWIVKSLLEKKAKVTVLIRDLTSKSNLKYMDVSDKVNTIVGTLSDPSLIDRIMNEYEVDTCFHLAAQAIVGAANRSPVPTFESNIRGTWNVLEACRNNHVKIVVASSDKAYGPADTLPYKEDHRLNARYPYDVSKACAELLSRAYWNTFDLPVVVARCSNIYGGGDFNFSRIIPGTISALLLGEEIIIRSDGTAVRDYLYVDDAVDAYTLLAERVEDLRGEIFNFGTGDPISVLDLTKKIIKISGNNSEPRVLGTAKSEIDKQYVSSEKAKAILGWKANCKLEEGLKKTIEWYAGFYARAN